MLVLLAILLCVMPFTGALTPASAAQFPAGVYALGPPLEYNGHRYVLVVRADHRPAYSGAKLVAIHEDYAQFGQMGISGISLYRDATALGSDDEDEIREVLTLFASAYHLYEYQRMYITSVPDHFDRDIRAAQRNPVFVAQQAEALEDDLLVGLLGREDSAYLEALRGLSTLQAVKIDLERAKAAAQGLETMDDVVDLVLRSTDFIKYLSDDRVAELRSSLQYALQKSGFYLLHNKSSVEVGLPGGSTVTFITGLDFLAAFISVYSAVPLNAERGSWLADYMKAFPYGAYALDASQASAADVVIQETASVEQLQNDLLSAILWDKGLDFAIRVGQSAVVRFLVQRSLEIGRYAGLSVAGGLKAVFGWTSGVGIVLEINNLVYNLKPAYAGLVTAEHAYLLFDKFHAARLALHERANLHGTETYEGDMAATYRAVYMLEALAGAQSLRSYGEAIGELSSGPFDIWWLNWRNWFPALRWSSIADEFTLYAQNNELEAEASIGHPAGVEPCARLILETAPLPLPGWQRSDEDEIEAAVWALIDAVSARDFEGAAALVGSGQRFWFRSAVQLLHAWGDVRNRQLSLEVNSITTEHAGAQTARAAVVGRLVFTNRDDPADVVETDEYEIALSLHREDGRWLIRVMTGSD